MKKIISTTLYVQEPTVPVTTCVVV